MPNNPAVLAQLNAFRSTGLTPMEAAAKIMQTDTPAVSASELSIDLVKVFAGITAAELVDILHKQFPDDPAIKIAQAVKEALPNTDSATMYSALVGAGFVELDARGAVNIIFPVSTNIQSTQPWQPTGVIITGKQTTVISCTGTWSFNPSRRPCGPNGEAGLIAKARYTLQGAPEGAMIGRVGSNLPFLVGASATVPAGQSGMLSLCINDDIDAVYGAGLKDNKGEMNVEVKTNS